MCRGVHGVRLHCTVRAINVAGLVLVILEDVEGIVLAHERKIAPQRADTRERDRLAADFDRERSRLTRTCLLRRDLTLEPDWRVLSDS